METNTRVRGATVIRAAVRKHPLATSGVLIVVLVLLAVGAYLFQPWRIFTSSVVNESLPGSSTSAAAGSPSSPSAQSSPQSSAGSTAAEASGSRPLNSAPPAAPVVVSTGAFQSQEHTTTGTASLVRLPDGSHVVRLENLASSDGPDVKVWLSDQAAGGDWFKYRNGRYLDLGPVKATHGNQNYVVPAGANVSGLATVVLWCDRFSVAFGSAALG
ncbi:DM13 domain-containing protein [Arthrobacter sp. M4]|uniref:DM13 domain-containing protein n=1 Tax=Arthrobacter sp. M4 TaxID=218160 RepID=UPI001CDC236F|nr:DM13 domain-containing protein [Arthrobacter sp. M4]MCA4132121.1 DM13 domain-containing protein [Arthrobacter sp. M4]